MAEGSSAGKQPQSSNDIDFNINKAVPVTDLLNDNEWCANGQMESKMKFKLKDSAAKLKVNWTPEVKDGDFVGSSAIKGEWNGKLWNQGLKCEWSSKEVAWHRDCGSWTVGNWFNPKKEAWFNPYFTLATNRGFSNQLLAQRVGFGFVMHGVHDNWNWRGNTKTTCSQLASGEHLCT